MAKIGIRKGFVDRGDPLGWDFATGSFTTDDTWRDLDLSSIVPKNAKAVLLRILLRDDVIGSTIQLRKKGNSNDTNVVWFAEPYTDTYFSTDAICPISDNQKLQYKATNTTFTDLFLSIKGWWI